MVEWTLPLMPKGHDAYRDGENRGCFHQPLIAYPKTAGFDPRSDRGSFSTSGIAARCDDFEDENRAGTPPGAKNAVFGQALDLSR